MLPDDCYLNFYYLSTAMGVCLDIVQTQASAGGSKRAFSLGNWF